MLLPDSTLDQNSGNSKNKFTQPASLGFGGIEKYRYVIYLLLLLLPAIRGWKRFDNPVLFAEDAKIFLTGVWNHTDNLFTLYAGYTHVLPRLIAHFAVLFPMIDIPLVMVLCAYLVLLIPVFYLLSGRSDNIVTGLRNKVFVCLIYQISFIPATTYLVATDVNWLMPVILTVILCVKPPKNRLEMAVDIVLIWLSTFSGPFSVFTPIVVVALYLIKKKWSLYGLLSILFSLCNIVIIFPGLLHRHKDHVKFYNIFHDIGIRHIGSSITLLFDKNMPQSYFTLDIISIFCLTVFCILVIYSLKHKNSLSIGLLLFGLLISLASQTQKGHMISNHFIIYDSANWYQTVIRIAIPVSLSMICVSDEKRIVRSYFLVAMLYYVLAIAAPAFFYLPFISPTWKSQVEIYKKAPKGMVTLETFPHWQFDLRKD